MEETLRDEIGCGGVICMEIKIPASELTYSSFFILFVAFFFIFASLCVTVDLSSLQDVTQDQVYGVWSQSGLNWSTHLHVLPEDLGYLLEDHVSIPMSIPCSAHPCTYTRHTPILDMFIYVDSYLSIRNYTMYVVPPLSELVNESFSFSSQCRDS